MRTNNIAFSSHGAICYPLKKITRVKTLPWYDFKNLPFVVMTYTDKFGSAEEAMVDMATIARVRHFMSREKECPVFGTRRTYYRFSEDIPFDIDNMGKLRDAPQDPSKPSYPKEMRKIYQAELHKRAARNVEQVKLENWLKSGYDCGTAHWDHYKVDCISRNTPASPEHLLKDIKNFVAGFENNPSIQAKNNNGCINNINKIQATLCNVVQYAVANKWLSGITTLANNPNNEVQGSTTLFNKTNFPEALKSLLYNCCEEVVLLARECSNDDGEDAAVATGVPADIETEHPDILINQGLQQSVLQRVQMPQPCWTNPIPEHCPGLLQMAFPFVFLSGDADPYQQRPRDIKLPKSCWEGKYMEWIAKQPEAQTCTAIQFWINGRAQRIASTKQVTIAIKNTGINRDNLPTKEDLLLHPEKRQELASKVLSMTSEIKDTDSYWINQQHDFIGSLRYFADPPSHRNDNPMEVSTFSTRSTPYNHHRAIHSLFPDAEEMMLNKDRYLKFRFANVLKHPMTVQWVHAFMAEIDTTIGGPVIQGTTIYWMRHEWGPNGNSHTHKLQISEPLNALFEKWKLDCTNALDQVNEDCAEINVSELSSNAIEELKATHLENIVAMWTECVNKYVTIMSSMYTNWNAGKTKDGKNTYEYNYDRKVTVGYADVEKMIDSDLCTGIFQQTDNLYVSVLNGTCRHYGHHGPNNHPSKTDRCAVSQRVRDRKKTKEKLQKWNKNKGSKTKPPKPVYKTIYACKRRKPQPLRHVAGIYQDPFKKKLKQFQTACNDGFLNGGCPFALLFNLNNVDDKAIVPSWLTKPPTITWDVNESTNVLKGQLNLHLNNDGEQAGEYAVKYASKPNRRMQVGGEILLAAMENLRTENAVTTGTFAQMYNKINKTNPQPIFQTVHGNINLPFVLNFFDCKPCSVLGISVVQQENERTKSNETDEEIVGIEYALPTLMEKFEHRWDKNVQHGDINLADFRKEMSVKEFADKFNSKWIKWAGEDEYHLQLPVRTT